MAEAKKAGWTLLDNFDLRQFTQVRLAYNAGDQSFDIEIICQNTDTLA